MNATGPSLTKGSLVSAYDPSPDVTAGLVIPLPDEVPEIAWSHEEATSNCVFGFNSRDLRSRPFNLLRRRVLKQVEARGWRLFGVVSATPGVGKSFVASNLAAALSRTPDLDVYLFDFDLRKSSVARIFGVPETDTLNRFLAGEVPDLRSIVGRLEGERLIVVPAIRSAVASGELLAGQPMQLLIEAMRALPDNAICVCDLPPVFANDDAAIVAARLDTYLLVLEEGRTTKKQIKDSMNILAPGVCGGTVLNHYHGGLISDDYGYGYGGTAGTYGAYYG